MTHWITSRKTHIALVAGALMLSVGSAYAQFVGPQPDMQPQPSANKIGLIPSLTPITGDSVLLPGDLCETQVFGLPTYDYKGRITATGDLSLPMAGTVQVGDLTVAEAEQAVANSLKVNQIVLDPHVSIHVLESPNHFATVTGEVKTPGQVPVYGERHLLDILAAAGGMTTVASPKLTIYRRGSQEPFQITLPADPSISARYNIAIRPGDQIVVPKVGVVYLIGALHNQGAVPLKNTTPLTLIEALSLAGGVNYEAALDKAFILRVSADGRQEIPFNVSDVLKHRVADQVLLNDDIILVPPSSLKAALKGGAAGVAATLLAGVGYIAVR